MNSTTIIYVVHFSVVAATAYFANASGLATWYFVVIIALPLLLSLIPRFVSFSFTLNARILFPLSVGLLCVSFYHFFPSLLANESQAALSRLGVSNDGTNLEQDLFQVNDVFKDAVSVLYAICAAFLLWKGLSDFDELKKVVYEETSEVRSITDFSTYFIASGDPDTNRAPVMKLRYLLFRYLRNMLRGSRIIASPENEAILEKMLLVVGQLRAKDKNDDVALEEIMKSVSQLSILRSNRTVCIEKRMSPFILTLMLVMSITMVSSFFGKATGEISIDYLYVMLLPTFYASIFMTLLDLSKPFDGYWSIKLEAISGVSKRLQNLIPADAMSELDRNCTEENGWDTALDVIIKPESK